MDHPKALCIRQSHNSSSSSILVSTMLGVGRLPSELPLSFCASASVAPRLLRTLSSKPGNEARCFLNGEPTLPSETRSGTEDLTADVESRSAAVTGVPDIGEPEAPRFDDSAVRLRGSAECWRLSYEWSVMMARLDVNCAYLDFPNAFLELAFAPSILGGQ